MNILKLANISLLLHIVVQFLHLSKRHVLGGSQIGSKNESSLKIRDINVLGTELYGNTLMIIGLVGTGSICMYVIAVTKYAASKARKFF